MTGADAGGTRPLTARERAILHRMVAPLDDAASLAAQIDGARVSGGCGCGCPTIYLDHPPSPDGTAQDVSTAGITGSRDFLILFTADGWLDQLEHVPVDDDTAEELPDPDRLDVAAVVPS